MSVLSDKWIRKMALEHQMISPFEDKQIRGATKFLLDYLHLDMMQEFQMNLKYLLILIQKLLIQKILNQPIL